jgi:poly-gamma-glutamate capsule biosynthesis protein CapA/YwtB (metallophosphatase superfamily)
MFDIKSIPEKVSLRRLAKELNLNYSLLLKAAKRPTEGQVYDPNARNDVAINKYVNDRIDPKVLKDIDWEAVAASVADVAEVAKEFEIGQRVQIRQDENIYEIVLQTETHVVILSASNTTPRVLSKPTFLHQGPRLVEA